MAKQPEAAKPTAAASKQPSAYVELPLPAPVVRRGINEATWRTLYGSIYPGAKTESILAACDWCIANRLDVLKRPVHIVPMEVKELQDGKPVYVWRDVILPGIYAYRTTASRTGLYMGHSEPTYGPELDFHGTKAPEWCSMVFYRWNKDANQRVEFPVTAFFIEVMATKTSNGQIYLNARWNKAPRQMLTKCTEAAGLREAFPEELGGEHTDDEMVGHVIDSTAAPISTKPVAAAPQAITDAKTYTEVPVLELRALLDSTGYPEKEFLAKFAAESLETLPLNKVGVAFETLRQTPP